MQRLIATSDIQPGEELTICYLGLADRMRGPDTRRKLLRQYGSVPITTCNTARIWATIGDYCSITRPLELRI